MWIVGERFLFENIKLNISLFFTEVSPLSIFKRLFWVFQILQIFVLYEFPKILNLYVLHII